MNYKLIDEKSTGRMVFQLGEEWDSAANNQLVEADSDQQDQMRKKSSIR
jgi:hypothetical protein